MGRKSSFQLINRGRKDRPCWTVEEDGRYVYSSRRKYEADGYLWTMRREARRRDKLLAEGYHLPGLK